ncbi:unnamed protein product, partial [Iphiclides podalirius]
MPFAGLPRGQGFQPSTIRLPIVFQFATNAAVSRHGQRLLIGFGRHVCLCVCKRASQGCQALESGQAIRRRPV